jgi:hypothetical protein
LKLTIIKEASVSQNKLLEKALPKEAFWKKFYQKRLFGKSFKHLKHQLFFKAFTWCYNSSLGNW